MKKKTIIILVVILVAIAVLVWKFCPCGEGEAFSWADHLSEIKAVLREANKGNKLTDGQSREVQISREADLTGDGMPEALVLAGTGGAYTEDLALFVMKDGKPALAKFVNENGEREPIIFAEGASVRNGSKVDWQPEKKIIYMSSWGVDFNGVLDSCGTEAYQYDGNKQAFVYDKNLSASLGRGFCSDLRASL